MKTKKNQVVKYMHTIASIPAEYYPGEQIYYRKSRKPVELVESLAQILREQRASKAYRKAMGFSTDNDYGWVRVAIK